MPDTPARPKLLVFVVAYQAETTLAAVLKRIPLDLTSYDTRILVIDDSSTDRSFEVALELARVCPYPLVVLANRDNQGYGGNQKLGYAYAIREGFDVVVLLHGDGQYAPECLADLVQPIVDGRADAVMGSRMSTPGAARRGGMPLYKWVGNKILTRIQNRLLHSTLSEFHSGYRAYRVATLAQLPFECNTNAFHFDTEIIIQLLLHGDRVVEVPIPTFYGDEVCRVDGIRYARDVLVATVRSRLHGWSLFYDRRFDVAPGHSSYDVKLGYESSHTVAVEAVQPGSRVLDVGCGPGAIGRLLKEKHCRVVGVDLDPRVAMNADAYDELILRDAEEIDLRDESLEGFDYVLLLDILEHLRSPEGLLERLRAQVGSVRKRPVIVATTANVAFWLVRVQMLLGNVNYGKHGILDLTHTRLFTFSSFARIFRQCGYRIDAVRGIPAPYPKALGLNRLSRALVSVNRMLIGLSRGLFSYQIYLEAVPLPTVDELLNDSIAVSRARTDRVYGRAGETPALAAPDDAPASSAKMVERSN
ncbi:MAG: glycosyltransferase [Vicinamibacterales bacterium]